MKKHREPTVFKPKALALAVAGCFCLGQALANPVGGVVVAGSASFATAGNTLTVTNSPGAIINWQGFSIQLGETTRFDQLSAASSVLNRVITSNPSQLFGTLSSNGRVFLINPAGILVGTGAVIDTAGFVGSTLNLSNADFLANRLNFTETPGAGKVENYGSISTPAGGSVYLIGAQVENHGIINTPQGEVLLAAGKTAQLIDTATPGVRVEITADSEQALNLGQILADSGRVGMVGAMVRNSGRISASSVTSEGGRVFLKATQDSYVDKSGSIEATGTKGGQVEVLGNRVALLDQASINVSGTQGGGTILVGGDYQGKNADVQNAAINYVGKDVTLNADATVNGDGGKVIVWADDITRFYGDITAKGGAQSGNGGFVEVSGKRYLDFQGMVHTSAAQGLSGTLLLDPSHITIIDSDSYIDGNGSSETPFVGTEASSSLSASTLHDALAENHVIVDASGGYSGSFATGNITVAAGIQWDSSRQLTLKTDSAGSVDIYKPITASIGALKIDAGSGGVTQNSDGVIATKTLEVLSAGSVVLDGATNMVNKFAANVSGGGLAFKNGKTLEIGLAGGTAGIRTADQPVNVTVSSGDLKITSDINAGTGEITLTSGLGNVYQEGSSTDIAGSKLTVNAKTGINLPGSWFSGEGGYYIGNSTPVVELHSTSGDVLYNGNSSLTVDGASTDGSITLFAQGGWLAVPGNINAGSGDVWLGAHGWIDQTVDSTTGSISGGLLRTESWGGTLLTGANAVTGFTASNYGGGNIKLLNTAPLLTLGAVTQAEGGDIVIANAGSIATQSGVTIETSDALELTAVGAGKMLTVSAGSSLSAADIKLTADRMALAGDVDAYTDGTVWLRPYSAERPIDLGSTSDTHDALELSNAELSHVSATGDNGKLIIGDEYAGNIHISAPITIAPSIYFDDGEGYTGYTGVTSTLSLESGANVTQAAGAVLDVDNLRVWSSGNVVLNTVDNQVNTLQADLSSGSGSLSFTNAKDLYVTGFGISTWNNRVDISVPSDNTIYVNAPITAGEGDHAIINLSAGGISYNATETSAETIYFQSINAELGITLESGSVLGDLSDTKSVTLETDTLTINSGAHVKVANAAGNEIQITPYSAETSIDIGSGGSGTLVITDTSEDTFNAPDLVIGTKYGDRYGFDSGNIWVLDSISRTGRVALLTGGSVSQAEGSAIIADALGVIAGGSVQLDGSTNDVSKLAIQIGGDAGGDIAFKNSSRLTITSLSGGLNDPVTINGVSTGSGNIEIKANHGIELMAPVVTDTSISTVTLDAPLGAIKDNYDYGGIKITANGLVASANSGVGELHHPDDEPSLRPIRTQVSNLLAYSNSGDVAILNKGALTTDGGTSISTTGDVYLKAMSPLTIGAAGVSGRDVTLIAGASGPGATTDNLTITGLVTASRDISVSAGNGISGAEYLSAGRHLSSTSNLNPAADLVPPVDPDALQGDQGQTINALKTETQPGTPPVGDLPPPPTFGAGGGSGGTQTFEGGVVGGEEPDTFGSSGSSGSQEGSGNGQRGRRSSKPGQCRG